MLGLSRHRWKMPLLCRRLFLWGRTPHNPTFPTVITNPVRHRIVADRSVVNVANDRDVHIIYRAIVKKLSSLPPATLETITEIAVAIIDSAVEPDLRTPVAIVVHKSVAAPTPISGGPEEAYPW